MNPFTMAHALYYFFLGPNPSSKNLHILQALASEPRHLDPEPQHKLVKKWKIDQKLRSQLSLAKAVVLTCKSVFFLT